MASFSDQKPRIATEEDCQAKWGFRSGKGEGFLCRLCGHKFVVGDYWRWVFAGDRGCINALVCEKCDGPDVVDRWTKIYYEHYEFGKRMGWFDGD